MRVIEWGPPFAVKALLVTANGGRYRALKIFFYNLFCTFNTFEKMLLTQTTILKYSSTTNYNLSINELVFTKILKILTKNKNIV